MRTAIVGGGAAGFFLAINLKEMMPSMEVDILERSSRVLTKVEMSGGGRCNCTNTFEGVSDLCQVYPRGHRLMKRLMNVFDHHAAFAWFERHGVTLTIQDDHCVFPTSQDSHTIIDCFMREVRRHGIHVLTRRPVNSLDMLSDYDFVCVTTGGHSWEDSYRWLADAGHEIAKPVPSLFSLSVRDTLLNALMGTVAETASVAIPGTKFRSSGPLLITHWGLSGPAILKLSSHAARHLHECGYRTPILVNWNSMTESEAREELQLLGTAHHQRQVTNTPPHSITQRLWQYICDKSLGADAQTRWCDLSKKSLNRLVNTLTGDDIAVSGCAPFRDEFVTCGGVSLQSVRASTLESKSRPCLYFAGEVLDIDGITGGFNFQAAWTTAYVVAESISRQAL